jgi:hypothetical protein
VAGRFPLYTDADLRGPWVDALIERGWDVLRAVDAFPEATDDHEHFARAAKEGRVLVGCDWHQRRIAQAWIKSGRPFRGLVTFEQQRHAQTTAGDVLKVFKQLAEEDEPFAYPIRNVASTKR